MSNIAIKLFSIKLRGLTDSVIENSIPDKGAVNGIPPKREVNNYSNSQKIYREGRFDERLKIYGAKRRNMSR